MPLPLLCGASASVGSRALFYARARACAYSALDTLCREDSIARERAAWSSECDVLRTALSSSTKALSEELVASVDKLNAQCGTLEADVSSGTATLKDSLATLSSTIAAEQEERRKQLGEMQATAVASAAELERSTSARLDESAAGVQSACAKMNADIAQTAEDVLAIRTVMDAKIERECEALEASLQRATQGFGDRLGSFQDEINGQVVVRLDDFDSKLGGMQKRLAPCEDKLLEANKAALARTCSHGCVLARVRTHDGCIAQAATHMCCKSQRVIFCNLTIMACIFDVGYEVHIARNICCNVIEHTLRGHTPYCASEICHFRLMEENISNARDIWTENTLKTAMAGLALLPLPLKSLLSVSTPAVGQHRSLFHTPALSQGLSA